MAIPPGIAERLLGSFITRHTVRKTPCCDSKVFVKWPNPSFWLLARIANDANQRMIASCASIRIDRPAIEYLDSLLKPKTRKGKRILRLNPTATETIALFKAVAHGSGILRGFSNSDLQHRLHAKSAKDAKERRRRTCRICRKLQCLRGRGLIARIPGTRRYRLTQSGRTTIHAAIRFHDLDFPALYAA